MNLRAYRTFQGLILAALGLFLLSKLWDGSVLLYINQRFVWLVVFAAIGLVILSQVVLQNRPPAEETRARREIMITHQSRSCLTTSRSRDCIWLEPVVAGTACLAGAVGPGPAFRYFSSGNARHHNQCAAQCAQSSTSISLEMPSAERTVLDWNRTINYASDPFQYNGEPADVTGFVYHDPRLQEGEFLVGRFTLTCCVADAFAIGMVVLWAGTDLPDNSWVRVQGTIEVTEEDGQRTPAIRAQTVEQIPEPPQPYLYP
jgi:putative membrane protein